MRPSPGIHVEWVDDEAVVLDSARNQLHYLNTSAAYAFGLIQELGFDEAMTRLSQVSSAPAEVEELVADMVERGLLTDD